MRSSTIGVAQSFCWSRTAHKQFAHPTMIPRFLRSVRSSGENAKEQTVTRALAALSRLGRVSRTWVVGQRLRRSVSDGGGRLTQSALQHFLFEPKNSQINAIYINRGAPSKSNPFPLTSLFLFLTAHHVWNLCLLQVRESMRFCSCCSPLHCPSLSGLMND